MAKIFFDNSRSTSQNYKRTLKDPLISEVNVIRIHKTFKCRSPKSNSKRTLRLRFRMKICLGFKCIFWLSGWLIAITSGRWQFGVSFHQQQSTKTVTSILWQLFFIMKNQGESHPLLASILSATNGATSSDIKNKTFKNSKQSTANYGHPALDPIWIQETHLQLTNTEWSKMTFKHMDWRQYHQIHLIQILLQISTGLYWTMRTIWIRCRNLVLPMSI